MTVAQAAGVGGGSLAYSSVALEAHPSLFTNGWPREITYDELKPYYDRVAQMMNLQVVPDGQLTQRFKLAREAAEKTRPADSVSRRPRWRYRSRRIGTTRSTIRSTRSTPRHSPTRRASSRAPASTSATATSAATSGRRTRWTSITFRGRSSAGPRCGALHVVRRIEPPHKRLSRRLRSDRAGPSDSRRGDGRPRVSGRRQPGIDRAAPAVPRRAPDAAGHQPPARPELERQRERALDGHLHRCQPGAADARTEHLERRRLHGRAASNGQQFVIEDDGFPNVLLNALRACLADGPRDRRRTISCSGRSRSM